MSLFTTLSTKLVASSLALAGGIGGVGAIAASNPTIQADFKNVETAITSKDLSAFKAAEKQLINDKTSEELSRVDSTTQDQLNSMSDRQTKGKATQDAINNNDYNAFKANANQQMLKRTPDQASFDKLVASNKARTDATNKISDAIKNNDFNAFKTAKTNEMQNAPANQNGKTRPTPTDAQLQTEFDKLVANYKANGSLPNQNEGMGMFGGMRGRHGGGHGFDDAMNNGAPNSDTPVTQSN
jgi:hypothetical protein